MNLSVARTAAADGAVLEAADNLGTGDASSPAFAVAFAGALVDDDGLARPPPTSHGWPRAALQRVDQPDPLNVARLLVALDSKQRYSVIRCP